MKQTLAILAFITFLLGNFTAYYAVQTSNIRLFFISLILYAAFAYSIKLTKDEITISREEFEAELERWENK